MDLTFHENMYDNNSGIKDTESIEIVIIEEVYRGEGKKEGAGKGDRRGGGMKCSTVRCVVVALCR